MFGGWVGGGIGSGSFVIFCNKRLIPAVDIGGVTVGGCSRATAVDSWALIQSDCMGDGPSERA
jgi:hypothetical protein